MARILAAAALGAGPALAAGAASAAPAGPPSVEFSGGSVLNMLVCKSQPSTGRLTVPADSKVTFVNRLGQNATLRVGGKTVTSVGANQAVPVVFHHGPVDVSMTISCSAGVVEEFRPVTVGVTAKPPAAPAAVATTAPNGRTSSGTTSSQRGNSARTPTPTPSAVTPSATAEVDPWASTPPTAELPSGVPADGSGNGVGGGGDLPPGATDVGDVVAASGEPVHGPSGLLAMIAAVLTVGVGVAAVRAVLARRTYSARFA
jgi:hypothetical protein